MEKVLQVGNVTKYYGGGSAVAKALDGISFSVEKGEFTAVMGPSGSGKSTLLNVIATIDRVSSGDIFLGGRRLTEMKERELSVFRRDRLGFVFQEYNLLDTLTVGENIVLPLNLRKTDYRESRRKLEQVAAALEVADQLNKFPRELSGGQRQRAACARAIITDPALVLADEPTGALDSRSSRNLMETFRRMNRSLGSTILMVTHDPVVGSYADRVLFLKDGRVWNEVYRGDRSRQTLYGEIMNVSAALGGEGTLTAEEIDVCEEAGRKRASAADKDANMDGKGTSAADRAAFMEGGGNAATERNGLMCRKGAPAADRDASMEEEVRGC